MKLLILQLAISLKKINTAISVFRIQLYPGSKYISLTMPIAKREFTHLQSCRNISSQSEVLHFSISREVSLENLATTIKAYYNHMCEKCYFPEYK